MNEPIYYGTIEYEEVKKTKKETIKIKKRVKCVFKESTKVLTINKQVITNFKVIDKKQVSNRVLIYKTITE